MPSDYSEVNYARTFLPQEIIRADFMDFIDSAFLFQRVKGPVQDAIELWLNNLMSPNFTREMCLVVDFLEAQFFTQQLNNIANGGHPAYEESLFQRLWILSSFVNGCLEVGVKPVIYCKS